LLAGPGHDAPANGRPRVNIESIRTN